MMITSWQGLVIAIRKARQLSQEQLAHLLGTDQACVSRWERGLTTPQHRYQKKIAALAEALPLAPSRDAIAEVAQSIADGIAGYGAAIFDRNELCIAASHNIVHRPGKPLAETTRPRERIYLDDWRRFMAEVDFWNTPWATFLYVHESRHRGDATPDRVRTLLTSLVIGGDVYCLIHFRTQNIDVVNTPPG